MKNSSKTNWARLDAKADENIDTSDIPPLGDDFFARATLRMPERLEPVSVPVPVDPDVLEWFRSLGTEYEQRMRAALRLYAEAHR